MIGIPRTRENMGRALIVCGMLRSGSTLIYQLLCAILEQRGNLQRLGFLQGGQSWLPDEQDSVNRVVKLHHYDEKLAALASEGRVVPIYTYRDPRDGVVSAMRQFDIPFDKALEWYEYAVSVGNKWESLPYTLSLSYESLIKDLVQLVAVLSAHIDADIDASAMASIAADHTRNKQRDRASQVPKGTYDSANLLHYGHISGSDENSLEYSLNDHEISRIESSLGGWMRTHGYSVPLGTRRLSCS